MKIVFIGDSITDSGRDRENGRDLGEGYVKIAAGKLRLLYPEAEIEVVNRGVSGDRVADVLARAEEAVKEEPDITVLQVGVNDVWQAGEKLSAEAFERDYCALVRALKKAGGRVILLQPYVLKVGDKSRLRPALAKANAAVGKIAEEEGVRLIPLDEIFTGVSQDIDPALFAADGVHPTHRGCRYIADLVIKELKKDL